MARSSSAHARLSTCSGFTCFTATRSALAPSASVGNSRSLRPRRAFDLCGGALGGAEACHGCTTVSFGAEAHVDEGAIAGAASGAVATSSGRLPQVLDPLPVAGTKTVFGSLPACSFLIDGKFTGLGTESFTPEADRGFLLNNSRPPLVSVELAWARPGPDLFGLLVSASLRFRLAYFAVLFFGCVLIWRAPAHGANGDALNAAGRVAGLQHRRCGLALQLVASRVQPRSARRL
mmetsp:Transcript_37212/g.109813  ORF Transcript_37212/g.109813 Transcript_37212/m.109813 type:complete len:234 (+) Transcript_37212:485-1186(+)